jgi:hypothetical protein
LESVLASWDVGLGSSHVMDLDKKYDLGLYNFYTATLVSHPIMNALASDRADQRLGCGSKPAQRRVSTDCFR